MSHLELLTVSEAAELRGVSKTRVRQWIEQGRLKKYVRYGRVLVARREVLALKSLDAGRPAKK